MTVHYKTEHQQKPHVYPLEAITTLKAKRETETGVGEQEKHQDLTTDVCTLWRAKAQVWYQL